jgi:hypothetical protein
MLAVASAALFLITHSPTATTEETACVALGSLVLGVAVMRVRTAVARRRGHSLGHYSWTPALFVGAVAAGLHSLVSLPVAYAPPPFTEEHPELKRLHLLGPLLLTGVAISLLIAAHLTGVPLTFELGFAGFVMAFSILTPVRPHDGGYFSRWERRVALAFVIVVAFLIAARAL